MSADHATTDGLREAVIDALYKADSIISWMLHRRASRLSDEDRQQLAEAMSALAKIDGHRNYRAALAAHPVPSDTKEEREGCNVLGPREATSRCVLWPDHVPPHQDSAGGEWPYAEPEPAAHPVPAVPEEERECACGHDKTDHRDEVGCIVKVAPSNRVVSPFCRCLRFAAQPSVPTPAPERCPESWVPAAGGPGHQCVKPAGHDGAHDSTPAPEDEQREALADLAPWLRDWRATPCEHSAPMRETCCAPCLRDRLLASDWLREERARVWDEGWQAYRDDSYITTNPYREAGEGRV